MVNGAGGGGGSGFRGAVVRRSSAGCRARMNRRSRMTVTTASARIPSTGSRLVESNGVPLDFLAADAAQRPEAGVVTFRLAHDEALPGRIELDVRRRLAPDVRDLPRAILL